MLLDNLFPFLGETGTVLTLIGILAVSGAPAVAAIACAHGHPRLTRSR